MLVWMVKAPVFQAVVSPPNPACLTTNELIVCAEPRSTVSVLGLVCEQNLLLLARLPSTARSALSAVAQAVEPVTGRPRARFGPRVGGAAGGVKPSVKDGGTSVTPVPQPPPGPPSIVYA